MKIFNMNKGEGYTSFLFPDNQPHINIEKRKDLGDRVAKVICSITSSQKLLELQMLVDALDRNNYVRVALHIPYLMGARYDRVMEAGDSFDLKVISKIINGLCFPYVYLYDPHSDVSLALIENSIVVNNKALVQLYNRPDSILVIPDAGAEKKAQNYYKWNSNLTYPIRCAKKRDTSTGKLTIEVLNPEISAGLDCVIIDDLCDGGATFIEIAKQLEKPKSLTLIVTHGIFSKGISALTGYFDHIITTDSYNKIYNHQKVTQIPCMSMMTT